MTIRAYWPGETPPGQFVDAVDSNPLQNFWGGTTGNPTSPTPPEGLRWLSGSSTPGNASLSPAAQDLITPMASLFPDESLGLLLQFWIRYVPAEYTNSAIYLIYWDDDGPSDYGYVRIVSADAGGLTCILGRGLGSGGPQLDIPGSTFVLSADTDHLVRLEFGGIGENVSVYVDNTLVASAPRDYGAFTTPPTRFDIGQDFNTNSGLYFDAFAVGDSIADVYPGPPFVPPASSPEYTLTFTRRRR